VDKQTSGTKGKGFPTRETKLKAPRKTAFFFFSWAGKKKNMSPFFEKNKWALLSWGQQTLLAVY